MLWKNCLRTLENIWKESNDMALCKYCLICPKPCNDDCKDYEENKDFEYLDLSFQQYEQQKGK